MAFFPGTKLANWFQYSKEHEDVSKMKMLFDTIEGFIFSIPGISEEYDMPGRPYVKQGQDASPEWQQYQLEELQGAYLTVVLQYWTGTPIARTRVRQQRFGRIVAVSRVPHQNYLSLLTNLDITPPRPPSSPTLPHLHNNRPTLLPYLDPARILHPARHPSTHARQRLRNFQQRLPALPMGGNRPPLPIR